MGFSRPILWTFLPTPLTLDLIRLLDPKVIVYYCIDNLSESSLSARRIARSETEVLRRSDLVFVTSQNLYDLARPYAAKVEIFPFGVDLEHFEKVRTLPEEASLPEEMRRIPRPIAGYVGGIHKWLDQRLVVEVAESLPGVSFVFIGPHQTNVNKLRQLPNVHLLEERSHEEIPHYVRAFDVGLIPYVVGNYTDNVYPTKLNEYLAMGKPVVSTDLKEIRNFNRTNGNLVRVGSDKREFAAGIEEAIREDKEECWYERIAAAGQNSWQKRIEGMSRLIVETLEAAERSAEKRWEERLLAFYRGSSRIAAAAGGLLFLYLLISYTPLVWGLAAPLKLEDAPRPADAIVVLAGGVGESGLAGEGYQERVTHAVALYHSRHARHLIFSSGYSYLFKEAEIMRVLAVSLGVPAEAIALEEKAGSTYENVKFVKEILFQNRWRSILLVSSPYHMRRASLTFRKVAPEIAVTHTPVPESQFYHHSVGASLPQVRGILQEYLGILYYWWTDRI
jgi:uncharacterized SAM-binding protein YcdF (DUF218 family)/glycosyltransferase involved in cell wall biosynthesis